MSGADWIVLTLTLALIVSYGLYKSRTSKDLDGYFLSNRSMPWYLILLSIMGTQASAVTFISAPGQAYTDGMRFVQYYFGLPLAMVVLCITFVPIFHKLKVYTAYEFLENRFDLRTRSLTSLLFLLQRGLSTGISIYAPAIILSTLLGWNINITNILMGGLVIVYTMSGGSKAVAYTQQLQFIIISAGMFLAAYMMVHLLPDNVGFLDAVQVSDTLGRMNVITTGAAEGRFNWNDRYNIWSGVIGGFFLALSYFGTDQSQVGRYLTAKSVRQSRIGLLMNGVVKVPMQFLILLVGALAFTFYQFNKAPVFFNQLEVDKVANSVHKDSLQKIQYRYDIISEKKQQLVRSFVADMQQGRDTTVSASALRQVNAETEELRDQLKGLIRTKEIKGDSSDTNYIFLRFVVDYLPAGLVGLLIAVIFLAAWGSIAAALNSLSSTTVVDIHKKFSRRNHTDIEDYAISRWYTFGWGVFCIIVALFAGSLGSLIEAVNILGSLFYGVILGIFLVAFYLKWIKGGAVFYSAVVVELFIILSFSWPWLQDRLPLLMESMPESVNFYMSKASSISFLWLNAIGAIGVVVVAILLQLVAKLLYTRRQE